MFSFIWNNWWRHRQRFILMLIGALILSGGLSALVGFSSSNKGTIVDELQKKWHASYDIVVRPPGTRSVTEGKKLLEPNYLSGISGGISLDQYHKIKQIPGVSVAAPIAMIGYFDVAAIFKNINITKNGVYRLHSDVQTNIGPRITHDQGNFYFVNGPWSPIGKGPKYGVGAFNNQLVGGTTMLLAAVDPVEEAKLVGLDKAVLPIGQSRYFIAQDKSSSSSHQQTVDATIPVLASNHSYVDATYTFTVQRLDLPFNTSKQASTTMAKVKQQGGEAYLDNIHASSSKTYAFTSKEAHRNFLEKVTGVDPNTGKTANDVLSAAGPMSHWLMNRPSALHFQPVTSPFSAHWPFAYNIKTFALSQPIYGQSTLFRKKHVFGSTSSTWPSINPQFIGIYDPNKLHISKDPLTELPAETYQPAAAQLVLNAKNQPVNPPVKMKPEDNPYGLLTKPPALLTTLDAASQILGKKPISAIRIKVAGVKTMSAQSENKLKAIAKKIHDDTGLITDITLGSSPQPTLIHVPRKGKQPELGWIQQPWVKIGSSITLFREANIGYTGIIGSVMLTAIIYVFATSLVSLYARRKEFAILLAVGWRPGRLQRMLYMEALMIGVFVAVVTWTTLGWILIFHHTPVSFDMFLFTGLFGVIIYLLGTVIPALLTKKIAPIEVIQAGEMMRSAKRLVPALHLFSMALNQFIGKWRRGVLSMVSIALPTGLLSFFLFVTLRLKGIMYTTWLGQYVSFKVGPSQYFALGLTLIIAVLTTAEIMWQNVAEREPEIALLKALGWKNASIRFLIWMEGGWSGICAGVIGVGLSFGVIGLIYRTFPLHNIFFFLALIAIPIVTGVLGAVIPAEKAVRTLPSEGMRGQYNNYTKTEKRFRVSLSAASLLLIVGFITMIVFLAPQLHFSNGTKENQQTADIGTKGKLSKSASAKPASSQATNTQPIVFNGTIKKTIPLGKATLFKEESVSILPTQLTKIPQSVAKKPLKSNEKYVSVQVILRITDKRAGNISYRPDLDMYYLMTDSKTYRPFRVQITHSKYYQPPFLYGGGEVTAVISFKVNKHTYKKPELIISTEFLPEVMRADLK